MRVVLAPSGRTGEVHAFYGLGKELQKREHLVTFCAPEAFRSRIMQWEFPMFSSGSSFLEFLESETDRTEDFAKALKAEIPLQFVAFRDSLREADVVVASPLQLAVPSIAEQHRIPYVCCVFSPAILDRTQYPVAGVVRSSGFLQSFRRKSPARLWDQLVLTTLNREREFSHLKPVDRLYSHFFESGMVIVPADPELSQVADKAGQVVTGFWYWEVGGGQPGNAAGEVCVGRLYNRELESESVERMKAAGHRVVPFAASVEVDPAAFGRFSAVVHSGDYDLLVAALVSGVPQILVPHFQEDEFWAGRMTAAGIAVAPDAESPETILKALTKVQGDGRYRERAQAVAGKVRLRNGIANAAEAIEKSIL